MEILSALHQIQRQMQELAARPRPVIMYYLGENPPYAQAKFPEGAVFKIGLDGQTRMLVSGLEIPVDGCPCPEAIWRLNTGVFAWKFRRYIPLALFSIAGIVALQFLVATVPGAPGAAWFVDYFATGMNVILFTLAAVCLIAAVLYNFKRGITIRMEQPDETALLLEAGQPDISPDTLVMSAGETENPSDFAERVRDAYNELFPRGQYMLVFTFRSPSALIVRFPDTGSQEVFNRATLTKDLPGWMQEVCEPRQFERETWRDFVAYVRAFCIQYAAWVKMDKMKQGNPLKDMLAGMEAMARKSAAVIALMLFSLTAFAQGELTPVSARPLPEAQKKTSIFQNVPDSARLEAYKMELLNDKAKIGRELAPRQRFMLWFFHAFVVPVFFFIGLLAWFIAKAAFKEAVHDYDGRVIFGRDIAWYGHRARTMVFVMATLIAAIEIADMMVTAFFTSDNLWWAATKSVAYAFACYFIVTWITPNPRIADDTGGHPAARHIGGGGYPRIG